MFLKPDAELVARCNEKLPEHLKIITDANGCIHQYDLEFVLWFDMLTDGETAVLRNSDKCEGGIDTSVEMTTAEVQMELINNRRGIDDMRATVDGWIEKLRGYAAKLTAVEEKQVVADEERAVIDKETAAAVEKLAAIEAETAVSSEKSNRSLQIVEEVRQHGEAKRGEIGGRVDGVESRIKVVEERVTAVESGQTSSSDGSSSSGSTSTTTTTSSTTSSSSSSSVSGNLESLLGMSGDAAPIVWGASSNITIVNGQVVKTDGDGRKWDAGAWSEQPVSDPFLMMWVADGQQPTMFFGISTQESEDWKTSEHVFYIGNGSASIYEKGSKRWGATPYMTGNVFMLAVLGGVANFLVNGQIVWSSTMADGEHRAALMLRSKDKSVNVIALGV